MTSTPIRQRRRRTAESSSNFDISSLTNPPDSFDNSISPRLRRRRRRNDSPAHIDNPPDLLSQLIVKSDIEDSEPRRRRKRRTSTPDLSEPTSLSKPEQLSEKNLENDSVVLSTTNSFESQNNSQMNQIRSDLFQDLLHSELAEADYY